MRRLLTALAALAVVASACGSADSEIEASAAASESDAATSTTTVAPEVLRTGREAILANHTEGKPYVLWYWGAH